MVSGKARAESDTLPRPQTRMRKHAAGGRCADESDTGMVGAFQLFYDCRHLLAH